VFLRISGWSVYSKGLSENETYQCRKTDDMHNLDLKADIDVLNDHLLRIILHMLDKVPDSSRGAALA
jgi:hypothetical protein